VIRCVVSSIGATSAEATRDTLGLP
jgi:hypothetical protein